jgi:transcription initiation factor IIE alpha subunit
MSDTPTSYIFECGNCGRRPTAQDVISHDGFCEKCGDTVITYTIDAAKMITALRAENERLKAELARWKADAQAMAQNPDHDDLPTDITTT